jgi:integrase
MGMVASASSSRSAFAQEMAKSTAPNAEMWLATADLTVFTGLRRGELAGLPWRDVDFDNRQLVVQRNRLNPGLNTSEAKSTASNRTIPLSHRAITDLTRLRRIQEEDRAVLGTGWTDTGFLLVLPDGMPPNPDSITRRFKRDCERAGVRYMTWHGLRHTYATFSLAAGVQVHDVSRILGHSSIAITLSEYAWTLPGAKVEAMETLADFILGDDTEQSDRVVL